jgi:predicted phage terminase large subunit-like protein
MALTAELVEAFAGAFLSPRYDDASATPEFHRECWRLYCSPRELCAVAAPRGHAKSGALTLAFGLAEAMFRESNYLVIVAETEEQAIDQLGEMATEARENEDLRREFKIIGLSTDAKTDIIINFEDGYRCRISAKGAGQKMRGMKWDGKRPGLILCDDLEGDQSVESKPRREAFRRWFNRALLPVRRKGGKVRFHGTILHHDSLLSHAMISKSWASRLFKAHAGFDDFSEVLWPARFTEQNLRDIRQTFIDGGEAGGYSQEYLNAPQDHNDVFLRRADFLPMTERDYETPKVVRIGCDFAVSKLQRADKTSFTVGGTDVDNVTHIFDQYSGRWDTTEWLGMMLLLQQRHSPTEWLVEGGVIWRAVEHVLYAEMRKRNIYLNIRVINPVKDKAVRATAMQKRHRAGAMRFDKTAEWYPGYEEELARFSKSADAVHDDCFDSTAILMRGVEDAAEASVEDFIEDEEDDYAERKYKGRSTVTGY